MHARRVAVGEIDRDVLRAGEVVGRTRRDTPTVGQPAAANPAHR